MVIAGTQVSGNDGRTLVDLLLQIGRDADLALAHRIDRGYGRQNPTLVLSPAESDHLLGVIDGRPAADLAELRAALVQAGSQRRGEEP